VNAKGGHVLPGSVWARVVFSWRRSRRRRAGRGRRQRHSATSDGGATWRSQAISPEYGLYLFGVYFLDANTGTTVGGDLQPVAVILRTTNGGETWTPQEIGAHVGCGVSFGDANSRTVVVWNDSFRGAIPGTNLANDRWRCYLDTPIRQSLRSLWRLLRRRQHWDRCGARRSHCPHDNWWRVTFDCSWIGK
jgi:hypothetical protein